MESIPPCHPPGRINYVPRLSFSRPVTGNRIRRSIGSEHTYAQDISDTSVMRKELEGLLEKVILVLKAKNLCASTLTVKIKFDNFQQVTRSMTTDAPFADSACLIDLLSSLLAKTAAGERKIRLLGMSVSKLSARKDSAAKQLVLV